MDCTSQFQEFIQHDRRYSYLNEENVIESFVYGFTSFRKEEPSKSNEKFKNVGHRKV